MTAVKGILNGHPFRATLEPDKVNKKMRQAAGIEVGDVVSLEVMSIDKESEPRIPIDLRKALAAGPAAPRRQRNARCRKATRVLL
jgi:hypothetical protein